MHVHISACTVPICAREYCIKDTFMHACTQRITRMFMHVMYIVHIYALDYYMVYVYKDTFMHACTHALHYLIRDSSLPKGGIESVFLKKM
jgi:hypothetical protein